MKRFWVGLLVAVAVAFSAGRASAAPRGDFEQKIYDELADIDPDAVPIMQAADKARDAEKTDEAAKGYEEVLRRAPTYFHAKRRLCGVEVMRDRREQALPICREALRMKDTPENHAALAMALLATKDVSESDSRTAAFHAKRAVAGNPGDAEFQQLACRAALATHDQPGLDACSGAIMRLDEKDPMGPFFAAIAAASKGNLDAAEAFLERAKALGLPNGLYTSFKAKIDDAQPTTPKLLKWGGLTLASWFLLFGALFVIGSILSASALRAATRVPSSADGHAHGVDAILRKAYRVVLWASSAFYYLSLPLLAVFLIGAAVSLTYLTFMIGRIPIKLLLIVGLVVLTSLWAILKSLFVKVVDEDPGEKIDIAEHPKLRATLDEVAAQIGTRPVDAVYLTPGTEIAVLERGSFAKQLRGQTERALVLGCGVLEGMRMRAFKGILAHEYGHFHNEDTAGGGFAIAVRRSILKMAVGLAEGGAASSMNPAWWFVRGFHAVFLRISQGASRLQEVLADRWAAFAYGSKDFEEGMRHVVKRTLAFDAHADASLNEVIQKELALSNLYRYEPSEKPPTDDLDQQFDEAWNAEPSPYDSHPRPADRIAWVLALATEGKAPRSADDELDAWSLFADRHKLEVQMTDIVRPNIAMSTGISVKAA